MGKVPVDDGYKMRVDALAQMIAEDRARGDLPIAIIATSPWASIPGQSLLMSESKEVKYSFSINPFQVSIACTVVGSVYFALPPVRST